MKRNWKFINEKKRKLRGRLASSLPELDLRLTIAVQLRVEVNSQLGQGLQDGVAHLARDAVSRQIHIRESQLVQLATMSLQEVQLLGTDGQQVQRRQKRENGIIVDVEILLAFLRRR